MVLSKHKTIKTLLPCAAVSLLPLLLTQTAFGGINKDLRKAARAGDITEVSRLLKGGADVNAKSKKGETALKLAELRDHTETAKALIDAAAEAFREVLR